MSNDDVDLYPPKRGGSKRNQVLGIIYMLVLTMYILVDKIVIPAMNKAEGNRTTTVSDRVLEATQQVTLLTERTRRLEVTTDGLASRVENLTEGQATRTEAIANLKAVMERIERKLDAHMAREPLR